MAVLPKSYSVPDFKQGENCIIIHDFLKLNRQINLILQKCIFF